MAGRFTINHSDIDWYKRNVRPWHDLYNSGILLVFQTDREHYLENATATKIELLDKAYSAALRRWFKVCDGDDLVERHIKNGETKCTCSPSQRYAEMLHQNGGNAIRDLMKRATDLGPTLTKAKIKDAVGIFEEFRSMLRPLMRRNARLQSFFSKYLWFQAGIFPVYDNYARLGLTSLSDIAYDDVDVYGDFAKAVFEFMEALYEELGEPIDAFTPAQIKFADLILVQTYQNS